MNRVNVLKSRKRRGCRRNSRRMAGGQTQYYSFGAAVSPTVPGDGAVLKHDYSPVTAPGRGLTGSDGGLPMKGGRYQFAGSVNPATGIWESGAAPIPCEASRHNALNQGGPTPTTSAMRQSGGVAPFPFALQETTAGYTQLPAGGSIPLGADGTPIMLHVPAGGRMGISPACTSGGRRRKSRKGRKGRCKGTRKH